MNFIVPPPRVFEAMRCYIVRLAELAEKRGAAIVAPVLRALSERPPQSFHEALQLAYLYHEVQEIEGELVRSMGCFDRLYIDFYRRDIASGALTREEAKELLKFFWIKFYAKTQGLQAGKNFCFRRPSAGRLRRGQRADGSRLRDLPRTAGSSTRS